MNQDAELTGKITDEVSYFRNTFAPDVQQPVISSLSHYAATLEYLE